jgi:hypothetical protein
MGSVVSHEADPAQVRRVLEYVHQQLAILHASGEGIEDAVDETRLCDVVLIIGALTTVAAHALDCVEQLGGSADEALSQALDLWQDAIAEARAND